MCKVLVDDELFVDNNLDQRKRYKCPVCQHLLQDAVQTSCGHWFCSDCAAGLFRKNSSPVCPRGDCGELLEIEDGKEFFPDKFVRKEINKFQVRCRYHSNKCPWTGTLLEQLKHLEVCIYEQEQCPHCHEMFGKTELSSHERNCPKALTTCPFAEFGCEVKKQMTRTQCDEHLNKEVASHSRIMASLIAKGALNTNTLPSHIATSRGKPEGASNYSHTRGRTVESDGASNFSHARGRTVESDGAGYADDTAVVVESLRKQLASKESQLRHLQDKLQQVEATISSKTTENEDRDFRLSLLENSNYDGTMLWKIPQFSQRMDDARTGKYTSIFSLPFYSGRYGYKMCLRLYILGDGIGKGSHMSLFFVLMKGEFDNILQWPFNHKVTFKLINQSGGRDVVDIFQPDPLSSSFQKPKTDMNIASGCPRFVSLNELMQNGFILEDTLFVKVKVDTTTMKHP